MTGVVTFYCPDRRIAFIAPDGSADRADRVYVAERILDRAGLRDLQLGEEVEFEIDDSRKPAPGQRRVAKHIARAA